MSSQQAGQTGQTNDKDEYLALAGIAVSDEETRAHLFEFIPALTMVKYTDRDRVYLIDLKRLASLWARGARGATATPVSRVKPLLNEDRNDRNK